MSKAGIDPITHAQSGSSDSGHESTNQKDVESNPPNRPFTAQRLSQPLHERHINMLALSGTIGSGLFLNTGEILALAGPGGAILAYAFMGLVYMSVITCLGEMVALMPVTGPIIEFPSRFLDKRIGFAAGWMYWLTYAATVPAQAVASASLMNFNCDWTGKNGYHWGFQDHVHLAVWILGFVFIIFIVNMLPVRAFGEVEWAIGSLKMLVIVALTLLVFIIPNGNFTPGTRKGYRDRWNQPGFFSNNGTATYAGDGTVLEAYHGSTGRFFSMWAAMTKALWGYIGMDIIAVAAAETQAHSSSRSPVEKEVFKISTRKIYIRVISLYCWSLFAVSFAVASTDGRLHHMGGPGSSGGHTSPFIIAIIDAGIPTLPHIINGFFVLSATSAGIIALYAASRTLYTLALQDFTPTDVLTTKIRRLTNQSQRPLNAVLWSSVLAPLAFLACKSTPKKVFDSFERIAVVGCLIVMAIICLTYIRFLQRLENLQNNPPAGQNSETFDRTRNSYPYKSRIQPFKAWAGFIICSAMVIMNGFRCFLGNKFNGGDFAASYIALVLFIALFIGYNVRRQGWKNWSRITLDLPSGFRSCDENARRRGTLYYSGKPFWEKVKAFLHWLWIWCN